MDDELARVRKRQHLKVCVLDCLVGVPAEDAARLLEELLVDLRGGPVKVFRQDFKDVNPDRADGPSEVSVPASSSSPPRSPPAVMAPKSPVAPAWALEAARAFAEEEEASGVVVQASSPSAGPKKPILPRCGHCGDDGLVRCPDPECPVCCTDDYCEESTECTRCSPTPASPDEARRKAEGGYRAAPPPVVWVPEHKPVSAPPPMPRAACLTCGEPASPGSRYCERDQSPAAPRVGVANPPRVPRGPRACGTCGEPGHQASKCPTVRKDRCFQCRSLYDAPEGHDPKTQPCPRCIAAKADGILRTGGQQKLGREASAEYLSRKRVHEQCLKEGERPLGKSTQGARPPCDRCGEPCAEGVLVQEDQRHKVPA